MIRKFISWIRKLFGSSPATPPQLQVSPNASMPSAGCHYTYVVLLDGRLGVIDRHMDDGRFAIRLVQPDTGSFSDLEALVPADQFRNAELHEIPLNV